jgi:hypothetical protein
MEIDEYVYLALILLILFWLRDLTKRIWKLEEKMKEKPS